MVAAMLCDRWACGGLKDIVYTGRSKMLDKIHKLLVMLEPAGYCIIYVDESHPAF